MVTIKDIAKKANVAVSTVSYVLNNKKKVSPETRARILKVIEEYNYQPRSVARSLKTGKTLTIGIIMPDITNLFFTEMTRGIEDTANQYGYTVILCNTDKNPQKELDYLNTLYSKDVDGIIFVGTCKNHQIIRNREDTPIVMIDSKAGGHMTSVQVNNIRGGFIATSHLLERKKSEVLLLTGPLPASTYFERMTGYLNALRSKGFEYNELMVHECDVSFQGGYNVIQTILDKKIEVHSVFAVSDVIALGAIRAMVEKGIKIPQEVLVVGYDDISISSMFIPSLTTVRQPKYLMGQKAVELLIGKIKDPLRKVDHVVLEPELIIRESTDL
jgi:LacI family transcriptional regulator